MIGNYGQNPNICIQLQLAQFGQRDVGRLVLGSIEIYM